MIRESQIKQSYPTPPPTPHATKPWASRHQEPNKANESFLYIPRIMMIQFYWLLGSSISWAIKYTRMHHKRWISSLFWPIENSISKSACMFRFCSFYSLHFSNKLQYINRQLFSNAGPHMNIVISIWAHDKLKQKPLIIYHYANKMSDSTGPSLMFYWFTMQVTFYR